MGGQDQAGQRKPPLLSRIFSKRPRGSSSITNASLAHPVTPFGPQQLLHDENRYGLNIIYEPKDGPPCADIVLVHGLGGTCERTFTWPDWPNCFWPEEIAQIAPFTRTRILTFGYYARGLKSWTRKSTAGLNDLALNLLCQLKDGAEDGPSKRPIFVVAHSLGGIVVRTAYNIGAKDDLYRDLIKSIHTVFFMGTPHRGSNLVNVYTGVTELAGLWMEPYFRSLMRNSPELEKIDSEFRDLVQRPHIYSFYETLRMAIGPFMRTVVHKESAVLKIEGEVEVPMETDHRDIVRYPNITDATPRKLFNRLADCIKDPEPWTGTGWSMSQEERMEHLRRWLRVDGAPVKDLSLFSEGVDLASCSWIQLDDRFKCWLKESQPGPSLLWVTGMLGSGRSTLAASIIRHVRSHLKAACHFFFFVKDEPGKTSLADLLRSLAFQVGHQFRRFSEHLVNVQPHVDRLSFDDTEAVWKEFFDKGFTKLFDELKDPIYWIVDDLGTSKSASHFIAYLRSPAIASIQLKVLILSEYTQGIADALSGMNTIELDLDEAPGKLEALKSYVETRIGKYHPLLDTVLQKAQGNFEWARLMIDSIGSATDVSILELTGRTNEKFASLWQDTATRLIADLQPKERTVMRKILTWTTCARCRLTIRQVSEALSQEDTMQELDQPNLNRICNGFITVDEGSRLRLRHQSARDFLASGVDQRICEPLPSGHAYALQFCLRALLDGGHFGDLSPVEEGTFGFYAVLYWPYHLQNCVGAFKPYLLDILNQFLTGRGLLLWIYRLASLKQLEVLRIAANALVTLSRIRCPVSDPNRMISELKSWSRELVMILVRFGSRLLRWPQAILTNVHPFCPQESLIRQQLIRQSPGLQITVKGISATWWSDHLAHLTTWVSPYAIVCSGDYVAIASNSADGAVSISSVSNFSNTIILSQGERVRTMRFSYSGDKLVIFGKGTVKVWQVQPWRIIRVFDAPQWGQVLDVAFRQDGLAILACNDDGDVWEFKLLGSSTGKVVDRVHISHAGSDIESPEVAAFSQDGTKLVASYPLSPMRVWSISDPTKVPDTSDTYLYGEKQELKWERHDGPQARVKALHWTLNPRRILVLRQNNHAWIWDAEKDGPHKFVSSGVTTIFGSPSMPFLVTTDNTDCFNIWDVSKPSLLYRRRCEGRVSCLTLCPRGRRIYGLRGSGCDVWEPAILVDVSLSGTSTDHASLSATRSGREDSSLVLTPTQPKVENLAVAHGNMMYCVAYTRGDLQWFESNGNPRFGLEASHATTILFMTWSNDDRYLAVLDTSRRLMIYQVSPDQLVVTRLASTICSSTVIQLLFSEDGSSLLIISEQSISSWLFQNLSQPGMEIFVGGPAQWLWHPRNKSYLLGITAAAVHIINGDCLQPVAVLNIAMKEGSDSQSAGLDSGGDRIVDVFVPDDGGYLIVQTIGAFGSRISLLQLSVDDLKPPTQQGSQDVYARRFSSSVTERIARPLGFVQLANLASPLTATLSNAFAFVDYDGWVCSISVEILREHFFLPQDWLDSESLNIACLTRTGTLLIPKDGNIALIMNGFRTAMP